MISEPCVLHARDDDDFQSIQYIHVSFLSLFNHAINLAEALTIREMFFRESRFADIKPWFIFRAESDESSSYGELAGSLPRAFIDFCRGAGACTSILCGSAP